MVCMTRVWFPRQTHIALNRHECATMQFEKLTLLKSSYLVELFEGQVNFAIWYNPSHSKNKPPNFQNYLLD